ncbi:MAG: hypothetical protein CMK59_09765 [Proteobacteria bacterium]|nr:hypothetical protein [Pseudomonadota bacterium]
MNVFLIMLMVATVLDRGGIPSSLLLGLAVCELEPERFLFLTGCVFASFLGDILLYHLGIYLQKEHSQGLESSWKSKLLHKTIHLSRFVQTNPSLWMFSARAFPLTNQLIPIALGMCKHSLSKTYLSAFLGGLVWMSMFFWGFEFFVSLQSYSSFVSVGLGLLGLIAVALAMRRMDEKVFQH